MTKKKIFKELFWWVRCAIISIIFAVVFNSFIIANAVVISGSMESTIMTDSRVIASRLAYLFDEPQRYDIILFRDPDGNSSIPFVKRIIGLPNETVEIIEGKVYIDNCETPLNDYFIRENAHGNFGPFEVPENSYFVLGDNRNNSLDSKNWENSFVIKNMIIGKLYASYFPSFKILD